MSSLCSQTTTSFQWQWENR